MTIDPAAHSVRLAGERLELRRQEYELLLHLASDPRRVFRKHDLLEAVWGYHSPAAHEPSTATPAVRRKLSTADEHWIVSVRGVGYRLV